MIYNGYEYVKSKGITRRRNLVKNNIKKKIVGEKYVLIKIVYQFQKGNLENVLNIKKGTDVIC